MNKQFLASMIDVSAVRGESALADVQKTAAVARQYHCAAAFALPAFTEQLRELLDGSDVLTGGVTGFPSGGDTTAAKAFQAKELVKLGCGEIDMVMNVGKMLSALTQEVEDDIKAVKEAIGSIPLKVILECHYLSDDQIKSASEAAVRAGASWVKTGTGWAAGATALRQVQLMKQTVGNAAKVKAAGGIRDLETLLQLYEAGAERFGIGSKTVENILASPEVE